jgi:hypothetical protein
MRHGAKNVRSTWTIQRNARGFYSEIRAFRFQDSAHLLAYRMP